MSFPTVYYITQVIPSCYSAGYAMCVCVSFGACVYRSLAYTYIHTYTYPNQNCFKMIVENLASFNRTELFEEQSSCSSFKWLGRI